MREAVPGIGATKRRNSPVSTVSPSIDDGGDGLMREVGVVNDIPHSVEHLTAPEIVNFKRGLEQRKILGLQSGPEPVRARICFRSMGNDDIVTPVHMTRMRADRLSGAGSHRHFRE
jgi:hypothetical protein